MPEAYRIRKGTVLGDKHAQHKINNQDAVLSLRFNHKGREHRMGIVSDGCSGIPAFSRSETGAHLIALHCMLWTQQFVWTGAEVSNIPRLLYPNMLRFFESLTRLVVPSTAEWPYDMVFKGNQAFRNTASAAQRFMFDYLTATIVGFVDDGETLVTFQAGDGVQIVNDAVCIVNQNDEPEYPVFSVGRKGGGFTVATYRSAEVKRLALATDGIVKLLEKSNLGLRELLFTHEVGSPHGLQFLLNGLIKQYPELMADDCTVLTQERLEV